MGKHPYQAGCACARCVRELARRTKQSGGRPASQKPVARRERGEWSREAWDAYESGRPMSEEDR